MKRKFIAAVSVVLLVFGVLATLKVLQFRKMMASAQAMVQPPESIASAIVREESWQDTLRAIGSISAVQGVTISPEISGTVRQITFESGEVVSKGALLARLDTTSEEAQLRAIEAQVNLARLTAERMRNLRAENTVSQSEWDNAEAALKQTEANADTTRAAIEKKTLRAPFAGKLGIRQINLGQYVDAGKPVVSLQSLSPVYANFSLPQQELARLKTSMPVQVWSDAYPDRMFEGVLTAINPDLDSSTRSVDLQATLDNPDHLLRPGMFARLEVLLPSQRKLLVIPATAVLSAPYGESVFVIEPHAETNKAASTEVARQRGPDTNMNNAASALVVRQQFVRTGRTRGDFVSVEAGLQPGQRIASSGLFKLRNGMRILENNELTPPTSETPRPADK